MIKTPQLLLPDSKTLARRLSAAVQQGHPNRKGLKILRRKLPSMMSTFPNEVVDCLLPDGHQHSLFIKYQTNNGHEGFGHRGGVSYEARVYREVLAGLDLRPRYFGTYAHPRRNETWLILEYLPRTIRVSDIVKAPKRQPVAMAEAAEWIGRFHANYHAGGRPSVRSKPERERSHK